MTNDFGQPTTIASILKQLGPLVTSTHGIKLESSAAPSTTGSIAGSFAVHSVNSPVDAGPQQIAFVTQAKYLEKALNGKASVLCFPESARETISTRLAGDDSRPHFFSHEPELAMRQTVQFFFQKTPYINRDFTTETELIHKMALIHPTAKIGENVRIGPFAVVSSFVTIGDGAVLGAHTIVESATSIGARTVLHPLVYIGPRCEIGSDCEIHPNTTVGKEGFGYAHDKKNNRYRIPHTGRVIIEDRVHLGSSVNVDRGTFGDTRICAGAILDNRIQISHNAVIGENAVITAGFVVAGSTKIGKNFLTGGNSTVTGHIEVCDNVQLSALSVVRKSLTKPGAYGGNPLMPMREYLRFTTALLQIPQLLKKFRRTKDSSDATELEDS